MRFLANATGVADEDGIVHLSRNNSTFAKTVYGYQIVCTRPRVKTLDKAWSNAYIEIYSERSKCEIREGVDPDDKETLGGGKARPVFANFIYWLRSITDAEHHKCRHTVKYLQAALFDSSLI